MVEVRHAVWIVATLGDRGSPVDLAQYGRSNGWFQRALSSGEGRIRAADVDRDVAFEEPGAAVDADLHAAYHAKYDRYGPSMVGTVVSPETARSTLRLVPR
jgi:hypothetical protein